MQNKSTIEEFIEKASIIHKNKYDYSKFIYIRNKIKSIIICPIHGEFEQTANTHLSNHGCFKCRLNTFDDFKSKAINVHGNKYKYISYNGSRGKVNIICPEHGEFEQTAYSHLNGNGCPTCSGRCKQGINDFIIKSKKLHGDKYDYSKVEYKTAHVKVCIICPIHGEFSQKAREHYRKSGCPSCRKSIGELKVEAILKSKNIIYEKEFRFEDCRNKNKLPFDFYLKDYNMCIEYDGEQHFKAKDYFGGEDSFEYRKRMDQIKTQYCVDNNIKLLRIPYYNSHIMEDLILKVLYFA